MEAKQPPLPCQTIGPGIAKDMDMPRKGKPTMIGLSWGPCNDASLGAIQPSWRACAATGMFRSPTGSRSRQHTHSSTCCNLLAHEFTPRSENASLADEGCPDQPSSTSWLYQDLLDFFCGGGGNRGSPKQNRLICHEQSHPWREAIGFESQSITILDNPYIPSWNPKQPFKN